MELIEAIKARRSIRRYKSDPVPRELIAKVLDLARLSPSATNCQPWEFVVLTGDTLEKVKRLNIELLTSGTAPDNSVQPYTGIYRERQVVLGKEIFRIMGIGREDREKRKEWEAEGMRFFGAPVVILICVDDEYFSTHPQMAFVNVGIATYAITLAALEYGLGTCIQFQGIWYAEAVKKAVGIPESKHLVSCISLGYPDWEAPINKLRSERESLDNLITWIG